MSRIFFFTRWPVVEDEPRSGGPRMLQQKVRVLRSAGHDARIVLGGETSWFRRLASDRHELAISLREFKRTVGDEDWVVVPAIHAEKLRSLPGEKKVLMIQNGGLLFESLPQPGGTRYPWRDGALRAIICVSRYDVELVEMASPDCPVYHIDPGISEIDFEGRPWGERENLVLTAPLLPYKNPWHTKTLAHLLVSRATAGTGAREVPRIQILQDLPHAEVIDLMGRAKLLVFVSLCEGFGLLPLEAALAGTPVLGCRNQPYQEFLPEDCLHAPGDFRSMVESAEEILDADESSDWLEVADTARRAAAEYTEARCAASILDVWNRLLEAGTRT